jgi:hypothetical protein
LQHAKMLELERAAAAATATHDAEAARMANMEAAQVRARSQ